MADDGWGDLEKLAGDAMRSAREFTESTRSGAGSPIERRMAAAIADVAENLSAQARALESIAEQQSAVAGKLDQVSSGAVDVVEAAREVRGTIRSEARTAMEEGFADFSLGVDSLERQTTRVVQSLERLDGESTEEYRRAVEESVGRLRRTTAGACAVIVLMAAAAGIWALVGASWLVRTSGDPGVRLDDSRPGHRNRPAVRDIPGRLPLREGQIAALRRPPVIFGEVRSSFRVVVLDHFG